MLVRQILGYAPSLVVSALASFANVTLLTWLINDPAIYGQYALAITSMAGLIGVCYFWLQSAMSRLLPQALKEGRQAQLLATLYLTFGVCSLVLMVLAMILGQLLPLGDWRVAVCFAPPLAIFRALLNLNQSVHRTFVRIVRYNIIEIGQAVIGLGAAVALVAFTNQGAAGAATGLMIGLAMMCMFDWRMLSRTHWRDFDRAMFREVAQFGLPFVLTYGLSFILSGSDRFLIEYFMGPSAVGVYSAGYAYPDRIGQNLFMLVATASFPLTVRRLEQEGTEAARDQTYANGVALLALAIPACVGMLITNAQIAHVLIGKSFSAGAAQVMPWIAVATIMNGIAAHYFDHAFHLAKKTRLFFATLGPAALLNFLGNLWAIPHFGYMGAAYTTVAAYALYLALSIALGRNVFRIKFPFGPAFQISLSAAVMAAALLSFHFPDTAAGLIANVIAGGMIYGAGLFAFDILSLRSGLISRFKGRQAQLAYKNLGLSFDIISTQAAFEKITPEWQELYDRTGRHMFGSPAGFALWRKHLCQAASPIMWIVTARDNKGRLVALLPLVVRRSGLLHILEWAGYEVFDYGDVLAENTAAAEAVWRYACARGRYDIALVKDVREAAVSLPILANLMRLREKRKNYFLKLDFASGEAWLAAQSRKLRGDTRRKTEKMNAKDTVAFHFYRPGDELPAQVIDTLYAQKAAWFAARKASGVFARGEVREFLHDLAQCTAREGRLYLAWMTCGRDIAACHMGFVRDGILYLYHTTYDAGYAVFSPGNILMIETIKWAIDAGLHELDFMRGDESYKQRFAGGSRTLSAFVSSRSLLGKSAVILREARSSAQENSLEMQEG